MRSIAWRICVIACVVPSVAAAQWEIASTKGDTIRLGYLAQVRAEWSRAPDSTHTAQNLFVRHLRFLLSGRMRKNITMFFGVDSPNLGKAQPDGTKATPEVGVYDFWVTYEPFTAIKFDGGLIGTPNSYNSIQAISGMLTTDFSPYSFISTPPTNARAGRDYGVQARGYVLREHLEYRAGVFQGYRGVGSTMPFRYLGRVVLDAFPREKAVYYSGTGLGTARHLALGASVDMQQRYHSSGLDLYADHPIGHGDGVTAQFDAVRYDGGTTFTNLPRQDAVLVELGYYNGLTHLSPFIQLARDATSASRRGQGQIGLGYYADGQKLNLKLAYAHVAQTNLRYGSLLQFTVQNFEF